MPRKLVNRPKRTKHAVAMNPASALKPKSRSRPSASRKRAANPESRTKQLPADHT